MKKHEFKHHVDYRNKREKKESACLWKAKVYEALMIKKLKINWSWIPTLLAFCLSIKAKNK
jgi:hypothetical protein